MFESQSSGRASGTRDAREAVAQVGAPVDVTVGANLTFEHGRGARSAPTRLAILGGAAALAVVTALVFLVGGIDHLYADRPAHGWPWDVAIGNTNFTLSDQTVATLTHDRRIRASTVARYGQAAVDDVQTELLAVDVKGTAPPELVSGRLPRVGLRDRARPRLLRRIGARAGDSVAFSIAGGDYDAGAPANDRDLTVVGVALAPIFGEKDVGDAGVVTFDASRHPVATRRRNSSWRNYAVTRPLSYRRSIATSRRS